MRKRRLYFCLIFVTATAFADVKVLAIKGVAGYLSGGKLQPLSVGMALSNDATVVTGANSELTVQINNGTVTFKSLTTAKLGGISLSSSASTADVALRSGTVVSDVKQIQGLKTSFTVSTPVGTSSVRGTMHSVSYSRERGMTVSVAAGVVDVDSTRSPPRPVPAGKGFVQAPGAPAVVASQPAVERPAPPASAAFAPEGPPAASGLANPLANQAGAFIDVFAGGSSVGALSLSVLFP